MDKNKQSENTILDDVLSVSFSVGLTTVKLEKSDTGAKVCFLQPYGKFPFAELNEEEWKVFLDKLFNMYRVLEWGKDYTNSSPFIGQYWCLHISLRNSFEKNSKGFIPFKPESWDFVRDHFDVYLSRGLNYYLEKECKTDEMSFTDTDIYNKTEKQDDPVDGNNGFHTIDLFESHKPILLLLDVSKFMLGESGALPGKRPIDELNEGVKRFIRQISVDPFNMRRIDIGIMTFSSAPVKMVLDFMPLSSVEQDKIPVFHASGYSDIGNAVKSAFDRIKEQQRRYESLGTPCYDPEIIMFTSGKCTDRLDDAKKMIDNQHRIKFRIFGTEEFDENIKYLSNLYTMRLSDTDFNGFFDWDFKS